VRIALIAKALSRPASERNVLARPGPRCAELAIVNVNYPVQTDNKTVQKCTVFRRLSGHTVRIGKGVKLKKKARDAEIIAGGAGERAVIGAVAGRKKGAAIGAITGNAAGSGVVLAGEGKEIRYASGTRLAFSLASSVQV
jgi:hypothetical protein